MGRRETDPAGPLLRFVYVLARDGIAPAWRGRIRRMVEQGKQSDSVDDSSRDDIRPASAAFASLVSRTAAAGNASSIDGSPAAASPGAGSSDSAAGIAASSDPLFTRKFWRLFAALSLVFMSTSLMNVSFFPLFDDCFGYARDISVTVNAASLLAIGLIATFRPALLHVRRLNIVMLVTLFAGYLVAFIALSVSSPALLIVGSSAMAIGRAWCMLVVGVAASRLSLSQAGVLVPLAFVLQCAASALAWLIPMVVGMILFFLFVPIAWAMTWMDALPILEDTEHGEAPSDLSVTRPSSFLPLASQFFVCMFLFRIAFGCSLRFGEVDGVPLSSFAAIIPAGIIAVLALVSRKRFPLDLIVQLSVLAVVGGFMAMSASLEGSNVLSVTLLSAGNIMFDVVAWLALIAVASRNSRGAVAVFAWGRGVSGLGTTLGATVGVQANAMLSAGSQLFDLFVALLVLLFVGYALIGLKNFSFAAVIDGVTPADPDVAATTPKRTFDERCAEVAKRYGLTPRELEVFQMLARGRDRAYIQEQLVVSRNTVKAHVKHIYAKLDIHSHQDLIDLVEAESEACGGQVRA